MCKFFGSISVLETRPPIGWLARSTNQRPGFQLTYASKTLAHDPALRLEKNLLPGWIGRIGWWKPLVNPKLTVTIVQRRTIEVVATFILVESIQQTSALSKVWCSTILSRNEKKFALLFRYIFSSWKWIIILQFLQDKSHVFSRINGTFCDFTHERYQKWTFLLKYCNIENNYYLFLLHIWDVVYSRVHFRKLLIN